MNTRLALIALAMSGMALPALAADYRVDETHSFVQFRTKHLGYSWLYGHFDVQPGGTLQYDPARPQDSRINLVVDVNSIDSNHEERDEHLREKYLFTAKQPLASFKSTAYTGDASRGQLTGEITLNGVTRTVVMPVKKIGEGKDPWGGYRVGFEGTLSLDAREYGYTYQLGEHSFVIELQLGVEGVRSDSPAKK